MGEEVKTIHSYKTYEAYKQSSKKFCKWLKLEYPNIKYISEIDRNICIKYIKHLEKLGYSAYTYSQSMARLNKSLSVGITKKDCKVQNRSLKNITKSRTDNKFRTDSQVIETIIRGTGLRRNELVNLEVKDLITSFETVTGVKVNKGAKGGKSRIVEVRKEYQKPIYKIINGLEKDSKVINEEIPKKLQTHRLRAEYAQNMYKELIKLNRKNPLQDLTESMGHNRVSVLVHYGVYANKKEPKF